MLPLSSLVIIIVRVDISPGIDETLVALPLVLLLGGALPLPVVPLHIDYDLFQRLDALSARVPALA